MFILDTNVVSELRKAKAGKADRKVLAWAGGIAPNLQFISAITLYEIQYGILLKTATDAKQGAALQAWLDSQIRPSFRGRVLAFDDDVALACAPMHVPNKCKERDSYIAATALVHKMTVATRDVGDFAATGAPTVNPWQ